MKEKLRNERGVTLIEMLCAVVILILLGLMLNTGLEMAVHSYQDITAQSEVQLLLSTLSDALADDLRYARDVTTKADGSTLESYSSDSYNVEGRASLGISENGQMMASGTVDANGFMTGGKRVLPSGAYGNGTYIVKEMNITYKKQSDGSFFTIELEVAQANGDISAQTEITVRCLSGQKATEGEGSGG